jgi:hypothetical protein
MFEYTFVYIYGCVLMMITDYLSGINVVLQNLDVEKAEDPLFVRTKPSPLIYLEECYSEHTGQ